MKPPRALDSLGHSVARYVERWHPTITVDRARGNLLRMLPHASFVEYDPPHEIWTAEDVGGASEPVLLVVDDHIVKTVLAPGSTPTSRRPRK